MRKSFGVIAVLVLAVAFAGCAATKKEITTKSQSERTDVFQEIAAEAVPQPGFSALLVEASLKKPFDKQTEDAFLLNIDGQSITWNIMGRKEKAPEYDEKGQPNPDRGEGMKYVLTKNSDSDPVHTRYFWLSLLKIYSKRFL